MFKIIAEIISIEVTTEVALSQLHCLCKKVEQSL